MSEGGAAAFGVWLSQGLIALGVDALFSGMVIQMLDDKASTEELAAFLKQVSGEREERIEAFVRDATQYHQQKSGGLLAQSLIAVQIPSTQPLAVPTRSPLASSEPHETDDIKDLLAGELDIDVSHLTGLSATAKEFTPSGSLGGGGGSAGGEDMDQGDDGGAVGMSGGHGGGGVADAYYYGGNDSNNMYDDGHFYYGDDEYGEADLEEDAMLEGLENEMMQLLAAVFPDCSEAALRVALDRTDWDMDHACRAIAAALQKASDTNQKPCRHFLNGECLRRDCMFSHDFAATICRYWLQGVCRNGNRCTFLHELDVDDEPSEEATEEDEMAESLNLLEISEFPTLGTTGANATPPSNNNGAAAMVVGSYGKSFAAVVATGSPRRRSSSGGSGSGSGGGGGLLSGTGSSGWGSSSLASGGGSGRRRIDVRAYTGASAWVATGDAVLGQYKAAREEAAELAKARNKLFMGATSAYRRGDRRSAGQLAKQGRELNDAMKEKHRIAATAIYAERNPRDQVLGRRMMDLHGLHVAEAQALLETELPALCRAGVDNIAVLTGTGHHSRGSNFRARLLPAVERLCQDMGLPFERVADRQGHVGVIHVALLPEILLYDATASHAAHAAAEQRRVTVVR